MHLVRPLVYRLPQVVHYSGRSRSSIYEAIGDGPRSDPSFPKPFAISARNKAWLAEEVHAWVSAQASRR